MKNGTPRIALVLVALLGLLATQNAAQARENGGTKRYTIKEVMITAYKEKLATKVIRGQATFEDKQRLLNLYEALAETPPPRGSRVSWQHKTNALVEAAQAAVEGHANAPLLLKKTMECGACHTRHK